MIAHADLWLLRHAAAVNPDGDYTTAEDIARPLTATGVKQALAARKALAKLAPEIDRARTSPRVRCVQTMALAHGRHFKRSDALDHDAKTSGVLDRAKDGKSTLVVGHHQLQDAIAKATGRKVVLPIGGLAKLEVRDGQWSLVKLLTPGDVEKLG